MVTFRKEDDSGSAASDPTPTNTSAETCPPQVREALAYVAERLDAQEVQLVKLSNDLRYLLERAKEHERQLTELFGELNRLEITVGKRVEQIDNLYSNGVDLAESIHLQSDHIRYLEGRVNRFAEALLVIAKKNQSTPAKFASSVLASWWTVKNVFGLKAGPSEPSKTSVSSAS